MTIISREGSKVTILDKGETWITKRIKLRHDSRRRKIKQKGKSVVYKKLERIPQYGDWLFTCCMMPQQFDKWLNEDMFITINGSQHSKENCSLSLISNKYAEFFNKHQLWELYDIYYDFEKYENAVKQICEAYQIKYEGI